MRPGLRLALPLAGVAVVAVGALTWGNLNQSLVYYYTPAEVQQHERPLGDGERFRMGGLVEPGTETDVDDVVTFTLLGEDGSTMRVRHAGAPAQLFRAGIGVVVEGSLCGDEFCSDTMLVKHDEEYRPPATPLVQGRGS